MSAENEEFEDFESDQEFSEDDDGGGGAELSDDEIANALELMGDASTRPKRVLQPLPGAARSSTSGCQDTLPLPQKLQEDQAPSVPSCEPARQEDEMSDFDRFLMDFTHRQQQSQGRKASAETSTTRNQQPDEHVQASITSGAAMKETMPTTLHPSNETHEKEMNDYTLMEKRDQDNSAHVVMADHQKQPTLALKWGVFSPDTMPMRHESDSIRRPQSPEKKPKKLHVVVPGVAYMRTRKQKTDAAQREGELRRNPELTFRPTINTSYYRRRGLARVRVRRGGRFTARMEQDISERQVRHQRRLHEKEQHEQATTKRYEQRRRSLVAKGSQAILQRNGLWDEPKADRLDRLVQGGSSRRPSSSSKPMQQPSKARKRAIREKETAKARACESLYRRGVDKLQRVRDGMGRPQNLPQQRRPSRRSEAIVRERLDREVRMICSNPASPGNNSCSADKSDAAVMTLSDRVSFVEFSCVLLYFGLVPATSTLYEGSHPPGITLLWHAWLTHAEGDKDDRYVSMPALKKILEMVILKLPPSSIGSTPRRRISEESTTKTRLTEILRLHYVARKRARGDGEKGEPSTSEPHPTARRTPGKVSYSLHGRRVESSSHRFQGDDLLAQRHAATQERIVELRREREQQELSECTFKPQLITSPLPYAGESISLQRSSFQDGSASDAVSEAFGRLYSDAFVRQNNSTARFFRAKMEQEEQWKKEMRVSPTFVNGLTIDERLEKLHESLSNNALPANFHHKIAEMRHAHAAKLEDLREKASRLEPTAHEYPKTKEGRTLVMPFTFATQERRERRRSRKSGAVDPSSGRDARSTRTLLDKMHLRYDEPLDFDGDDDAIQEQDDEEEVPADVCIDVHVSPFETYQLQLNRTDNVYDKIQWFGDTHRLDLGQRTQLQHHAELQLKELFDL